MRQKRCHPAAVGTGMLWPLGCAIQGQVPSLQGWRPVSHSSAAALPVSLKGILQLGWHVPKHLFSNSQGSWTLWVAAGSLWLDHLGTSFHNPAGCHGLIPDTDVLERNGSQASVNTVRWNLHHFHEHIKTTEDFVRLWKEPRGAGRAPVAPGYFPHSSFGKLFHASVMDICTLARERRAPTGRAGFWRGRGLSKTVQRAGEPMGSEHSSTTTRCPGRALQWPQHFRMQFNKIPDQQWLRLQCNRSPFLLCMWAS